MLHSLVIVWLTSASQAWVYCAHGTNLEEAQKAVAEFNAEKVSQNLL